MMNISLSNRTKPDHPVWKKIGDIAIYIVLTVCVVISKFLVPEPYKSMILEISAIVLPLIKGATKFTSKDNKTNNT